VEVLLFRSLFLPKTNQSIAAIAITNNIVNGTVHRRSFLFSALDIGSSIIYLV
jgi:hypothetical protein